MIVRCNLQSQIRASGLSVVNVYAPNSGERQSGRPRLETKLEFFALLREAVAREKLAGNEVVLLGDFNAPHSHVNDLHPEVQRKGGGDGSKAMSTAQAAREGSSSSAAKSSSSSSSSSSGASMASGSTAASSSKPASALRGSKEAEVLCAKAGLLPWRPTSQAG